MFFPEFMNECYDFIMLRRQKPWVKRYVKAFFIKPFAVRKPYVGLLVNFIQVKRVIPQCCVNIVLQEKRSEFVPSGNPDGIGKI